MGEPPNKEGINFLGSWGTKREKVIFEERKKKKAKKNCWGSDPEGRCEVLLNNFDAILSAYVFLNQFFRFWREGWRVLKFRNQSSIYGGAVFFLQK